MSIKNRNIRLPIHNLSFNHPLPDDHDDDDKHKHCFGEEILNENRLFNDNFKCDTNSDSLDSILNGINDLNTDKSSSSTISWGVGDENETTKIIQNELERIEAVLTGQQSIPDHYDTEEYNKWLKYFPRFCITGIRLKTLPNHDNKFVYFEELIAIHPDQYQQQAIIKSSTVSPETIKETLIEHIYKKLSKILINTELTQINDHKSSQIRSNLSFNIDDYLKISPIPSLLPQRYRVRRGHSSKSLISSQISSAKWLKDDTNDYTSLPFLADHLVKDECNLFLRNNSTNMNVRKSILKTRLVLPPIDQFRSISATPRAAYNQYSSNLLTINGEKLDNKRMFGQTKPVRRKTCRRLEKN